MISKPDFMVINKIFASSKDKKNIFMAGSEKGACSYLYSSCLMTTQEIINRISCQLVSFFWKSLICPVNFKVFSTTHSIFWPKEKTECVHTNVFLHAGASPAMWGILQSLWVGQLSVRDDLSIDMQIHESFTFPKHTEIERGNHVYMKIRRLSLSFCRHVTALWHHVQWAWPFCNPILPCIWLNTCVVGFISTQCTQYLKCDIWWLILQ